MWCSLVCANTGGRAVRCGRGTICCVAHLTGEHTLPLHPCHTRAHTTTTTAHCTLTPCHHTVHCTAQLTPRHQTHDEAPHSLCCSGTTRPHASHDVVGSSRPPQPPTSTWLWPTGSSPHPTAPHLPRCHFVVDHAHSASNAAGATSRCTAALSSKTTR